LDEPVVIIRWPRETDREATFEAGGWLRGRVTWPEILDHHRPDSGLFALSAECEGQVVGAATATVHLESLEVVFLARNVASQAAKGLRVGRELLDAASALAWFLKLPWLTLESLDDLALIAFYEGEGFVRVGSPLFFASWGTLHPMRRPPSFEPP
jgi:GNAT superfamily N-acetyltransferase